MVYSSISTMIPQNKAKNNTYILIHVSHRLVGGIEETLSIAEVYAGITS
jgi:hypothetical protein